MPLRQPRFIHQQTPFGKYNGFSVYFQQHDKPNHVIYSVALCSAKDQFCRKTARETAMAAIRQECRIVDFPSVIANLRRKCNGYGLLSDADRKLSNRYAWIYKYFL